MQDDNPNDNQTTPGQVVQPLDTNTVSTDGASENQQTNDASLGDSSGEDLSTIRQQVISELSPLIGHLDQEPEERFKTLMMMIQATDDQSLIKTAYEAAQKIEDEKTRAQALLDIVNEINYLTQNKEEN